MWCWSPRYIQPSTHYAPCAHRPIQYTLPSNAVPHISDDATHPWCASTHPSFVVLESSSATISFPLTLPCWIWYGPSTCLIRHPSNLMIVWMSYVHAVERLNWPFTLINDSTKFDKHSGRGWKSIPKRSVNASLLSNFVLHYNLTDFGNRFNEVISLVIKNWSDHQHWDPWIYRHRRDGSSNHASNQVYINHQNRWDHRMSAALRLSRLMYVMGLYDCLIFVHWRARCCLLWLLGHVWQLNFPAG